MRQIDLGSAALLECEACFGLWVDAETFEHLCADREAQAAVLHRWENPVARDADLRVRYRPCVRCGTMMNRLNFGKVSGVVVDVCKGHGTFLDAGELHQIVGFIRGGGLDRARERQLEDLKDEQARLRSLQATTIRDSTLGAGLEPIDGGDILSLLHDLLHR